VLKSNYRFLRPFFIGCLLSFSSLALAANNDILSDEQIDKRIQQFRTAMVSLSVTDSNGNPFANTPVTIRQVRHKFLFGCAAFSIDPYNETEYNRRFAEVFNYITLPFYWNDYEKTQGKTAFEYRVAQAGWCRTHNITPKGHPLCWHQQEPAWLKDKPLEEVRSLLLGRVTREVEAFEDTIDSWDAVNEAVKMPTCPVEPNTISKLCTKIGQVELIKEVFDAARKSNPDAFLILNDFEVWSDNYARLIEQCINAAVPVNAVGIQSHMHTGCWDKESTWQFCEKFAKFGKPIHFTEVTILSGKLQSRDDKDWATVRTGWFSTEEGEVRQAKEASEFYRLLFSHPAVEAITWWNLSDRITWLGAPAGLLHKDMTPKPAYNALKKLIKQDWWTGPLELKTDDNGRLKFRGFLGDYIIECSKGRGQFKLDKPQYAEKTVNIN
jgi:GH35 family endo-1,4-beta-xylanase